MATFNNLNDWAKHRNMSLDKVVRAAIIELFSSVILATRVDTGRLAGNWQMTRAGQLTAEVDTLDPTYQIGLAKVKAKADSEGVWYLINNLDYAEYWEERDAMVMRNVFRIDQIIRGAVREFVS